FHGSEISIWGVKGGLYQDGDKAKKGAEFISWGSERTSSILEGRVVADGPVAYGSMNFENIPAAAIRSNISRRGSERTLEWRSVNIKKSEDMYAGGGSPSGAITDQSADLLVSEQSTYQDGTPRQGFWNIGIQGTHLFSYQGVSDKGILLEHTFGKLGNRLNLDVNGEATDEFIGTQTAAAGYRAGTFYSFEEAKTEVDVGRDVDGDGVLSKHVIAEYAPAPVLNISEEAEKKLKAGQISEDDFNALVNKGQKGKLSLTTDANGELTLVIDGVEAMAGERPQVTKVYGYPYSLTTSQEPDLAWRKKGLVFAKDPVTGEYSWQERWLHKDVVPEVWDDEFDKGEIVLLEKEGVDRQINNGVYGRSVGGEMALQRSVFKIGDKYYYAMRLAPGQYKLTNRQKDRVGNRNVEVLLPAHGDEKGYLDAGLFFESAAENVIEDFYRQHNSGGTRALCDVPADRVDKNLLQAGINSDQIAALKRNKNEKGDKYRMEIDVDQLKPILAGEKVDESSYVIVEFNGKEYKLDCNDWVDWWWRYNDLEDNLQEITVDTISGNWLVGEFSEADVLRMKGRYSTPDQVNIEQFRGADGKYRLRIPNGVTLKKNAGDGWLGGLFNRKSDDIQVMINGETYYIEGGSWFDSDFEDILEVNSYNPEWVNDSAYIQARNKLLGLEDRDEVSFVGGAKVIGLIKATDLEWYFDHSSAAAAGLKEWLDNPANIVPRSDGIYYRLPLTTEKLFENKYQGINSDNIPVLVPLGKGREKTMYIDGGSFLWGYWFESDLENAVEDVARMPEPLSLFKGIRGEIGMSADNWRIYNGNKVYYADGSSLKGYSMQLWRNDRSNDRSIFDFMSHVHATSDYVDEVALKAAEVAGTAALTVALFLIPEPTTKGGGAATGAFAINSFRLLTLGYKAVKTIRTALVFYHLFGAGITGYNEAKSWIVNGQFMDPLSALRMYTKVGRTAAAYELAFAGLAKLSRLAVGEWWTGTRLAKWGAVNAAKSGVRGYAGQIVSNLPGNLLIGSTLGAGRALMHGSDPFEAEFWKQVGTDVFLFILAAPLAERISKGLANRKLNKVRATNPTYLKLKNGSGGVNAAETWLANTPRGMNAGAHFNEMYMSRLLPITGGLSNVGTGLANYYLYGSNHEKTYGLTTLAMDFWAGYLGTATIRSMMGWNKNRVAKIGNNSYKTEGLLSENALWQGAKRWAFGGPSEIKTGYYLADKMLAAWARTPKLGLWIAGDIGTDWLLKRELIGLHTAQTMHNFNNVLAIVTLASAFGGRPGGDNEGGLNGLKWKEFKHPIEALKKAGSAWWEGSGKYTIGSKGVFLPFKGGNAVEWLATYGWVLLTPEIYELKYGQGSWNSKDNRFRDIYSGVALLLLGAKILGPAANNFEKVQREWFGPTGDVHPWTLARRMASEVAHITPQLAYMMPLLPLVQQRMYDNDIGNTLPGLGGWLADAFDIPVMSRDTKQDIAKINSFVSEREIELYIGRLESAKDRKDLADRIEEIKRSYSAEESRQERLDTMKKLLVSYLLDTAGIQGTTRRYIDLGLNPGFSFWDLQKGATITELENRLKVSIDRVEIIRLRQMLDEVRGMSTGVFAFHQMATASWEGAKTGFTFGPTMYFVRPVLHPGLVRMPVLADIQWFIQDVLGDKIISYKPINRFQDFFVEENFREQITTWLFTRPVFTRMGGIFAGPNRAEYSRYEDYIAAQSRYQQVMEWFQESFDKGVPMVSLSSLMRKPGSFWDPSIADIGLGAKTNTEVGRVIARAYREAAKRGENLLELSLADLSSRYNINTQALEQALRKAGLDPSKVTIAVVPNLYRLSDQREHVGVGRAKVYVNAAAFEQGGNAEELISHGIDELAGHRQEAQKQGLLNPEQIGEEFGGIYSDKFLRGHPNRKYVLETFRRIHNAA
ncbi:MAG: hypothetical protein WC321_07440, partial [Candidatus Omnitrophota bacterium]